MSIPSKFSAFVAHPSGDAGSGDRAIGKVDEQFTPSQLDQGDVLVQVSYSAINYKDALAAKGNPGVARKLPLIPGIDAVGTVVQSSADSVAVGDEVLIAHAKFGTACHGGLTQYANVPADWVYKLPTGLDAKSAVTWGTAGFTAAQSVEKIVQANIPKSGPILVTGATGGVGIFAVKLLAKLGYHVVASTGKADKHEWLLQHGASEIISRSDTDDSSESPLLKGRWAGAVDTVGGNTLATILRSCSPHACVTACGLVAGSELPITVFPFILRGVTLCGIDSAGISRETRQQLWDKIATDWAMDISGVATEVSLNAVPEVVEKMLNGQVAGRTVVKL